MSLSGHDGPPFLEVTPESWCEETHLALVDISPASLEDFKSWRRSTGIRDNTLRQQQLLLAQFFRFCRKQKWIKSDPFAVNEDQEVRIPAEQESDVMHVLSPAEEAAYVACARDESNDLPDVVTIMSQQGPRSDEVLSLQQAHVDLFRRQFTIWDSSAVGNTKNAHRTLKMTDDVWQIFARRLASPGIWVFPSPKNNGPRRTLQKAHERATRGRLNVEVKYQGGCKIDCRIYDFRHTFATRFALAGGSLPILAKILGHADLSLLMRYVHPSQADMDRAMEWFQQHGMSSPTGAELLVSQRWTVQHLDHP